MLMLDVCMVPRAYIEWCIFNALITCIVYYCTCKSLVRNIPSVMVILRRKGWCGCNHDGGEKAVRVARDNSCTAGRAHGHRSPPPGSAFHCGFCRLTTLSPGDGDCGTVMLSWQSWSWRQMRGKPFCSYRFVWRTIIICRIFNIQV